MSHDGHSKDPQTGSYISPIRERRTHLNHLENPDHSGDLSVCPVRSDSMQLSNNKAVPQYLDCS